MSNTPPANAPRRRRRGFTPAAVAAGVAATVVLALTTTGTLAAFTAQITNNSNTAASGTLVMRETSGAATCTSTDATPAANTIDTNAATCTLINKYGNQTAMVPGGTAVTTSVTITNIGTAPSASFTLTPGACSQSAGPAATPSGSATNLCAKLNVAVAGPGITAPATPTTAATLTAFTLTPLAAGASATYTFAVSLDTSADNTYQNLQASQPLVWNFTS